MAKQGLELKSPNPDVPLATRWNEHLGNCLVERYLRLPADYMFFPIEISMSMCQQSRCQRLKHEARKASMSWLPQIKPTFIKHCHMQGIMIHCLGLPPKIKMPLGIQDYNTTEFPSSVKEIQEKSIPGGKQTFPPPFRANGGEAGWQGRLESLRLCCRGCSVGSVCPGPSP